MNKKSLALLEKALDDQLKSGLDIMQTQSKKRARKLVEDGYLIEAVLTLPGRFPVTIRGYRVTDRGRQAVYF